MKKLLFIFAALSIFIFVNSVFSQETEKTIEDKIKILTVTSDKPIVRGVEIELTVEIEYNFASGEEGKITIGFNTDTSNSYKVYDSLKISKGSEKAILKASIIPVDWGEKGDFSVLATVSKTPTPSFVGMSSTDTKVITVEKY